MDFSKHHRSRPSGKKPATQPRQYWNQRAYYKQEDFLPLPQAAIRTITHRVPDHAECQATRVLFACGHVLNEHPPCKEPGMRGKPCPLMNSYAPRHRIDDCMRCAIKQRNITRVSDLLKPRKLYLQGKFADKYREDGGTDVWRPQKHGFDPAKMGERKRSEQEEKRTGVKDAWKPKPVLPLFTEAKEKVKASLRHSESIESTHNPDMRRASINSSTMLLSGGRPSPLDGSTPLIEDESDASYSSTRSTPCPQGPAATSPAYSESTQPPSSSNRATPGDPELASQPPDHSEERDMTAFTKEEGRLKQSIASLRQKLDASTALINRMHLRNEVCRIENQLYEKKLQKARVEQQSAKEEAHAAAEAGRKGQTVLGSILCFLLLALVVYVNWSLFYSPEVSYVRQRRRALLGL